MEKKVALITLHGMGEYKPTYHSDLQKILIGEIGDNWDKVVFEPIQYQNVLQINQNEIRRRIDNRFDLSDSFLRDMLFSGFSDAGSLEHSERSSFNHAYIKVQKEIVTALDKVHVGLNEVNGPVIILAQSLGCQVISNYLWDAKNDLGIFKLLAPGNTQQHNDFRRLKTCEQLFTTGCNIPLFVAGLDPINAIEKPCSEFKWDNFFDKNDVLGWPLSPLSPSYKALVNDHIISCGGPIVGWNPLCHSKYWTDKNVINPLVDKIRSYL